MEARSELAPLLGWWKLVSCEVELQATGSHEPMYDTPAHGYLVFAPEGRMMTVIEAAHRTADARHREYVDGQRGTAYTGSYRVSGDQWFTQVDAASLVGWTGTLQERSFRIVSGRLHVCSAWCVSPLHGGQTVRARLVWERPTESLEQLWRGM
jgi:hypothetical protein